VISLPFRRKLKNRFPLFEKGMQRVVGKEAFEQIMHHCPDRRMLLRVAAEHMEKTERELLEEVAPQLGLRVAPRVIPTEAHHLPEGTTLASLRRAGCIAIVRESVFRGMVCSDPATIPEPFRSVPDLEYLLAPWSEIVKALGESEVQFEAYRKEREEERRGEEERTVEDVLVLLKDELTVHGQHSVKIAFEQNEIQYLFTTPEGKTGRGQIQQHLQKALLRFLERAPQELRGMPIQINCLERVKYYQVQYRAAPKELPAPEQESLLTSEAMQPNAPLGNARSTQSIPSYTVSVLLIDDNETFGSVVERFFLREGITVERRTSAQHALREIRNGLLIPKVVVCDLHMPVMNGVEFVHAIRGDQNLPSMSLFMLTSDEELDTEIEAIQGGVEAYLRKNEDPRLLCAHVQRVLRTNNLLSEAA
jgi:two-component system chemotaxis response regulator CheY